MKLAVKLFLTLGVLFIGVAIAGTCSLYQMGRINQIATDLSQNWLPATVLVQGLDGLTSDFRRTETCHVYSENQQAMSDFERKLHFIKSEINNTIVRYKKHISTPEEERYFQNVEELWQQYLDINKKILVLSTAEETKKAEQVMLGESQRQYSLFATALLKLVDLNVVMGKQASRDGNALYDNATRLITLILIVTLLLVAGLGGYLVRDILRNLGKDPEELGALARKIANGNLDVPADDEAVGVYADMLVMVDNLKQHIESIETLTSNIPGGVQSCLPDENITMLYVSDGFLAMTGYSREDLRKRFNNQFSKLLTPSDWEQVHASILTQLLEDNIFELEYSISHKDGHDVWILDRGRRVFDKNGRPLLYCTLFDITELKNAQKKLIFQEERCRAALCATHDFVFVSDNSTFELAKGADRWGKTIGTPPSNYAEAYAQGLGLCHADDANSFSETFSPERLLHAVVAGEQNVTSEYRLRILQSNQYWWFRATIVPFLDVNGCIDKLYGCISDINGRKQEERKILQVAQCDSLTGLYNKGFVEGEISNFLSGIGSQGTHALLIVDIDNFKTINDNLGHMFGDAVLTDVSSIIRKTFRSSDITGRIGGDEFIILLKDVLSVPDLLSAKANSICTNLHRTFSGEEQEYTISASVGIARFPLDGASYRELFRKADMALYTAKKQGKNQYCYYTDTAEIRGYGSTVPRTGLTDIAERSTTKSFQDDILSYIFELLYEARDIGSIVNIALGIIGRHYDVSRAYVFQNSNDDQMCSNTFEWCNDDIQPEQQNLQNIRYSEIGNYLSHYTQDGVFYCEDIHKLQQEDPNLYEILSRQEIRSVLHLAIFDEGKFKGYIGFDECSGKRLWTKDEIETLSILAKVLGVFLIKKSISRQLVQSYNNITAILDSLDVWAYVIDPETYELLYINAKTLELAPQTRVGEKCHTAFFSGRTEACEICPKAGLGNGRNRCTLEVFNEKFDLWTLATASRIPWSDDKEAVLLCCVDITHYKKTQR